MNPKRFSVLSLRIIELSKGEMNKVILLIVRTPGKKNNVMGAFNDVYGVYLDIAEFFNCSQYPGFSFA